MAETRGVRPASDRLERTAQLVSWAGLGFVIAVGVACVVLLQLSGNRLHGEVSRTYATIGVALTNAVFGGLLIRRLPHNPIGWILLLTWMDSVVTAALAFYAVDARDVLTSLPAQPIAAWLAGWVGFPSVGALVTLLVLLFPDGTAPTPRWRKVVVLSGAYLVVLTVAEAIASWPRHGGLVRLDERGHIQPGETIGGDITDFLTGIGFLGLLLLCAVCVVGLFRRRRGADPVVRQQLKWFLFACSFIFTFGFLPHFITSFTGPETLLTASSTLFALSFLLVPVATGLAILRYRLYDIDVVINRTLVYGALAAFITAVYVAIVVGIGKLLGSGDNPNPVLRILATAVVAVAFQPVRERVQRVANRVVYGRRATPYEVLSNFSARVGDSYAGEEVLVRMAQVLAEGTGAEEAVVWLRAGTGLHAAAAWPAAGGRESTVELDGQGLPSLPGADRAVAVRHQGELLGALSVSKRAGEPLTPIEAKLLDDLAHQAGLVLRNVGLTADLEARLADLRASRQRLVAAQDEERRRLERNLHDGAQRHLVAIKLKLGEAERLALEEPEQAMRLLEQLKLDTDETLTTVRDLARGIYPPLLADKGLATALESQARKWVVPVRLEAEGLSRYPQEVESAVYFCCLEALQNVQQHAAASEVVIQLREAEALLDFEVRDNGRGFDASHTPRGSGLTNMADRLDALGGSFTVTSAPGKGTRLAGRMPAPARALASG